MSSFLTAWASLTWSMIYESALLLLFGFMLAGVLRTLITPAALSALFGRGRLTQILTASIFGIPLPLCSCSVLPVAAQLRRSGLSKPGTVSFLISTPETGADSIALSVRLLGPIFAIIRPIAALITAFISGLIAVIFLRDESRPDELLTTPQAAKKNMSFVHRLWEGQVYVMTDMFPELAYYLFWVYLLAGLAAAAIPGDLLQSGLSAGWQYAAVIAVSLPVYVCATSSTPLAAVLLSLGILPGAVLAFLMVGPTTNLTSLVVQKKILGLKGTVVMTLSVIFCAVICGLILDRLFGEAIRAFNIKAVSMEEGGAIWYDLAAGIILVFFMVYFTGKHYIKKVRKLINR
jgi:uncharacterized membrane protein YraQ (UPF0718 family)